MDNQQCNHTGTGEFRTIIANALDGFTLINTSGYVIDVNNSYCTLVGYTRNELLGMHMSDLDARDFADDVARRSEEIVRNGSLRFETKHLHKNGSVIDVEVSANYTSLQGGSFFSFVRDITQQKRTEEALRERENELEKAQLLARTGSWTYDPVIQKSTWSKGMFTIWGLDPALGLVPVADLEKYISPADYPLFETAFKQAVEHGTPYTIELHIKRPDGRERTIVTICEALCDETGNVIKLRGTHQDITERKCLETANRAFEKRLKLITDNVPALIGYVDNNYNYTFVNRNYEKWFGLKQEEIVGKSIREILPEAAYTRSMPFIDRALGGEEVTFDGTTSLTDGTTKFFTNHLVPDRSSDGVVLGYYVLVTDITERKHAEDIVRESEMRFKSIFSNSPIAIGIGEYYSGLLVEVNDAWLRLFGYEREDVVGHTTEELSLYVNSEERNEILDIIKDQDRIVNHPVQLRHKSGSSMDIQYSAERIMLNSRPYLQVMMTDVTERKQAELRLLLREQALAKSELFLKTIVDSEPECIKLLDRDGNLLMMNPAGLAMIQADSIEQLKGHCVLPLITAPYRKAFMTLTRQVFQGIPGTLEFETVGLKGQHVWLETHAVPFRNEHGEIVALLGITRNVTERKKLGEERAALEQQFHHAQKMECLGVLASGVAHDFNNIMTIIKGNCELAMMNTKNAEDCLGKIDTAADRAAELCRQMLTYAGKADFTQSQINMMMLVDEMVGMLKTTLPQNIVIIPDLPSGIPSVIGDASQIRQIVMNLIINASEAIGDVQGEIHVSLSRTVIKAGQLVNDYLGKAIQPGWYVCLDVTDNGCGMDNETIRRIFEPFYTTKFTGRGLGMAAVLGIIMSHEGSLQLFSQLGHGTTFKVFLPILISNSAEDGSASLTVSSESWTGSGTILLVEDEELVREIAKDMFHMLGFNVIEAVDGREALELYQKRTSHISCVVTDLGMPVMDGYALFLELKKLDPNLPIVISSGFGDTIVTSRIAREDIAGLVSKPYSFDQLREVMKRVVGL